MRYLKSIILTLSLLFLSLPSFAQVSNNTAFRFRSGTSLPGSCNVGDVFFKTSATVGQYNCAPANTWTIVTTGGPVTPGGSNTQLQYNNSNAFGGAVVTYASGALTFPTNTGTGPAAIFNTSSSLTSQSIRFASNETNLGDYYVLLTKNPGSNGATRNDFVMSVGFNCGNIVVADHSFCSIIENAYTTSEMINQVEFYFAFKDGMYESRPFSITPNLDGLGVVTRFNSESVRWAYYDSTNEWLSINTGATTGQILIDGDSDIAYFGDNVDFLLAQGEEVLGYDLSTHLGRLFAGASTTSANFFAGSSIGSSTLTVSLGNPGNSAQNRGIRWNTSTGWEMQTGDSTWQRVALGSYWTNGQYVAIGGPSSINPGNATLYLYDNAATGSTRLDLKANGGGFQTDLTRFMASDDSITAKVDVTGRIFTSGFRLISNTAAVQDYFDSNYLSVGSGGAIGFSSDATWFGTKDLGLTRLSAGVLKVTNGSSGSGTIQASYKSSDTTAGASATVAVRKGDDSGSCNLVFKDGLYVSTTC